MIAEFSSRNSHRAIVRSCNLNHFQPPPKNRIFQDKPSHFEEKEVITLAITTKPIVTASRRSLDASGFSGLDILSLIAEQRTTTRKETLLCFWLALAGILFHAVMHSGVDPRANTLYCYQLTRLAVKNLVGLRALSTKLGRGPLFKKVPIWACEINPTDLELQFCPACRVILSFFSWLGLV